MALTPSEKNKKLPWTTQRTSELLWDGKFFAARFSHAPLRQTQVISFSQVSNFNLFVAKMLLLLIEIFVFFAEEQSQIIIKRISRRTSHGFNLIPSHVIDDERDSNKRDGSSTRDARVCYTLLIPDAPQLFLTLVCYFPFPFWFSISCSCSDWENFLFFYLKTIMFSKRNWSKWQLYVSSIFGSFR